MTKKDLTKKLPFSSTFLEVHFLLGINQSRPFSVEWIVPEFSEQHTEVITGGDDENEDEESNEQAAHPWINETDETIKTLKRLSMFTKDLSFDPLISKPTRIMNQWRDKWGYHQ